MMPKTIIASHTQGVMSEALDVGFTMFKSVLFIGQYIFCFFIYLFFICFFVTVLCISVCIVHVVLIF